MKAAKVLASIAVLVCVAAVSYAAGASKAMKVVPIGDIQWEPYAPGVPLQVAKLWGDRTKGEYAMLLKMPAGFEAGMHAHTADYHGVAISGRWVHTDSEAGDGKELAPGSYVFQPGKQMHDDFCKGTSECILLIHQHAKGDFIPKGAAKK